MCKAPFTAAIFLLHVLTLPAQYNWQLLPQSPQNGQKQDDVFFLTPQLGWSVNGSGRIFKTLDGGATWAKMLDQPGTYFRCIGFRDSLHGFAGNIGMDYFPNVSDATPLYRTDDGGASWQPVTAITGDSPTGLCAIQVVTPEVIVAGGRVGGPTHLLRSADGGATWTGQSLASQIALITDLYFSSPDTGFVFGGTSTNIQLARAKILRTTDGGQTWTPENVGQYVNKFRVLADVAYGIGVRIYKMTPAAGGNAEQDEAVARLFAWPNPPRDSLNVTFQLEKPASVVVQLFDSQGKRLLETPPVPRNAGRHTETLATGTLPAGSYLLSVQADGQVLGQTNLMIQTKP